MWFVSNRAGGLGGKDIWFTYNNDGKWSKPVNVGAPINSAEDEDQFWLPTAGLDVYWSRPGLILHCLSNGSTCAGKPETVRIEGCDYPGEASLTADGQYLYFGCGSTKTFRIQIMYSKKQPDGKWGPATPVD